LRLNKGKNSLSFQDFFTELDLWMVSPEGQVEIRAGEAKQFPQAVDFRPHPLRVPLVATGEKLKLHLGEPDPPVALQLALRLQGHGIAGHGLCIPAVVFVLAQHRLAELVGVRRLEGVEDDSGLPQGLLQGSAQTVTALDGHGDVPLALDPAHEGLQIGIRRQAPFRRDRRP
jgi:hypothetical protein